MNKICPSFGTGDIVLDFPGVTWNSLYSIHCGPNLVISKGKNTKEMSSIPNALLDKIPLKYTLLMLTGEVGGDHAIILPRSFLPAKL